MHTRLTHGLPQPATHIMKASGSCFFLAGLVYLIAETVAAAAWHTPPYRYAYNYISDLGVAGCGFLFHGRLICSPLHGLMNTGFIVEGVLFFLASILSARGLTRLWRYAAVMLGTLHGIGMLMVGTFNGSPEALIDGSLRYHLLGAQMAIVAGNLALMLYGLTSARWLPSPWYRCASVMLGGIGLLSGIMLAKHIGGFPDGFLERGSVYTIMGWEIVVGASMMRRNA